MENFLVSLVCLVFEGKTVFDACFEMSSAFYTELVVNGKPCNLVN